MLKRELTLKDGVALSIGSIMGSGILFLPSLTSKVAGADALISWTLAILLCLPLLFLFSDMLKAVPNESGLKGFIALGLGKRAAGAIPLLIMGTVILGMPAAAIIACEYLAKYIGMNHEATLGVAVIFITLSFVPALLGAHLGGKIQQAVAIVLAVTAVILFAVTVPYAAPNYSSLDFDWSLTPILQAGVICFWAFAGFENMTFLAGEFKNPKKDILTSIALALVSCGAIYFMVSLNYIALIPKSEVDSSLGLYQLATGVGGNLPLVITVFALVCVFVNYVSWTWGISRMLYSVAKGKQGFEFLTALDKNSSPRNALIFLWVLFCLSVGVNYLFPSVFERMLQVVSANFVVLYILASLSYARYSQKRAKKGLGYSLSFVLATALLSDPLLLIYPMVLLAIAGLYSFLLDRRLVRGELC